MRLPYERLNEATADARAKFMSLPLVNALVGGPGGTGQPSTANDGVDFHHIYRRFLEESYHHVRAAAKVYALAGSRISEKNEPIREWLLQHAVAEYGHHDWVLNDLKALGADSAVFSTSKPSPRSAALVAYMYYVAGVENPVAILADSYVIEGLSQLFASEVAVTLKNRLAVTDQAVTYLARHGEADQGHMVELKALIDTYVHREADVADLIQCARVEFELYGWIVEGIQAETTKSGLRKNDA